MYNNAYEPTTKAINYKTQPILLSRWWVASWSEFMGEHWSMSDEGRAKIKKAAQKRYEKNFVITACLCCGDAIKTTVARLNDGRGKYCSKNCFYTSSKGIRVAPQTEFKKGDKPWNSGTGRHVKCAVCSNSFRQQPNRKSIHCSLTCKTIASIREYKCMECSKSFVIKGRGTSRKPKYCSNKCQGLGMRNEKHFAWNGGSSKEREIAHNRVEYKDWRKNVFIRDNFTCQICMARGVAIEADHIKPWSLYPQLRYELENGRTLCKPCHRGTPTWGRKKKK